MNDYACILIWDAHTRMGHNIGPYTYGIFHTRMGRPIRLSANIRIWGRTSIRKSVLYALLRNAHSFYELFIWLLTVVKVTNKWIKLSELPVAYHHHH